MVLKEVCNAYWVQVGFALVYFIPGQMPWILEDLMCTFMQQLPLDIYAQNPYTQLRKCDKKEITGYRLYREKIKSGYIHAAAAARSTN